MLPLPLLLPPRLPPRLLHVPPVLPVVPPPPRLLVLPLLPPRLLAVLPLWAVLLVPLLVPPLVLPVPPPTMRETGAGATSAVRRGDAVGVLDAELMRESRNLLGHGNRSAMVQQRGEGGPQGGGMVVESLESDVCRGNRRPGR